MSQPILCTQNLNKAYGKHVVLRDINLEIYPGTLVGIVGENGAGKSTLLRILAGEARPNHGQIIRQGSFGYCPQVVILNEALTVKQHLDYFRAAYKLENIERAEELLDELPVRDVADHTEPEQGVEWAQEISARRSALHRLGLLDGTLDP